MFIAAKWVMATKLNLPQVASWSRHAVTLPEYGFAWTVCCKFCPLVKPCPGRSLQTTSWCSEVPSYDFVRLHTMLFLLSAWWPGMIVFSKYSVSVQPPPTQRLAEVLRDVQASIHITISGQFLAWQDGCILYIWKLYFGLIAVTYTGPPREQRA